MLLVFRGNGISKGDFIPEFVYLAFLWLRLSAEAIDAIFPLVFLIKTNGLDGFDLTEKSPRVNRATHTAPTIAVEMFVLDALILKRVARMK